MIGTANTIPSARHPRRRSFALLALAGSLGLAAAEAHAEEAAPVRTVPVAEGLSMLAGRGGNVAVLTGPDGPILVDDQYAHQVPGILEAVRGLQDAPIRFVINTHWHRDHTGGNAALRKLGALLLAHENVRARMSREQPRPGGGRMPPSPPESLPVLTFSERTTLHWNGVTVEVEHVRSAHTDGDAVVWFRERNAVHAGDLYFNGFYPFIDIATGGSLDGLIRAVDGILARVDDDTKIIPGHGPLSKAPELRRYRDMLAAVRERVGALVAAGRTAEEAVAARPTAEFDAEWGDGFLDPDTFVRLVHADLAR